MNDDAELIERFLKPARAASVRLMTSWAEPAEWREVADQVLASDYAREALGALTCYAVLVLRALAARSGENPDDWLAAVLDAPFPSSAEGSPNA